MQWSSSFLALFDYCVSAGSGQVAVELCVSGLLCEFLRNSRFNILYYVCGNVEVSFVPCVLIDGCTVSHI